MQNVTTGEHALQATIRNDRNLIEVLFAHELQHVGYRRLRSNGADFVKRLHNLLQRSHGPELAVESADFVRRDQSGQAVHDGDEKAAAGGAQQEMIDELLDAHAAFDQGAIVRHKVGGANALEQPVYFLVLGIQALQEEAFDKATYYLQRCVEVSQSVGMSTYFSLPLGSSGSQVESRIQ